MEQLLVLLVSAALVSFSRGWTPPAFCRGKPCPQYEVVEIDQEFEKRSYVGTEWISTEVDSPEQADLMAAHFRLQDYVHKQNHEGVTVTDSWPVLITVSKDQKLSLSWFIPPDTALVNITGSSVMVEHKPAAVVYVRVFGDVPSISSGQQNAKALWDAVTENCPDPPAYSAAGYDPIVSVEHHNEIWIYAQDIDCTTGSGPTEQTQRTD
ncbi:uncharacterized protein V6R79_002607 [Siganus canaliculatus]